LAFDVPFARDADFARYWNANNFRGIGLYFDSRLPGSIPPAVNGASNL
jgi:hypothetical protein